jgi:hypothetical protein
MSSRDQARILIGTIGGMIAVTIFDAASRAVSTFTAAVIGIGANVIFVALAAHWLVDSNMRYNFYRRAFDNRACLEGYWLSRVHDLPERPYEICVISYNPAACTYTYFGKSLSKEFHVAADWSSSYLEINMEDANVHYFYEGSVAAGNAMIQGFGRISFDRTPSNHVVAASGIFADADQPAGANFHRHTMQRITKSEMLSCLPELPRSRKRRGEVYLRSDEDYSTIARYLLSRPAVTP